MPLRQADKKSTKRFEDGDDWMVLRLELTKGEADAVRDISALWHLDPQAMANPETAKVEVQQLTADANRQLFAVLCKSWSVLDEDGVPVPITPEAYDNLDQESGEWVDNCISEVLRARRLRAEENASSSPRPSERVRKSGSARGSGSRAKTLSSSTSR